MSPPNITQEAATHLRHAVSELRGAKTSIGKGRVWLPRCTIDDEIQLAVRKIRIVELELAAIARKLELADRGDLAPAPDEASP